MITALNITSLVDGQLWGCCFRRSVKDLPWRLDWIWLHPFAREKKKLERSWPYFSMMFVHFFVMPPVSKSMYKFLQKQGYSQPKPPEEHKAP